MRGVPDFPLDGTDNESRELKCSLLSVRRGFRVEFLAFFRHQKLAHLIFLDIYS